MYCSHSRDASGYGSDLEARLIMCCPWKIPFFAFMIPSIIVRPARPQDCAAILELIRELASYEKAENEVELTESDLRRDAFGENRIVEMIVAEETSVESSATKEDKEHGSPKIVGTALYYEKYSTWKGVGLHLEDFVVSMEHRRRGIGSLLFEAVIRLAAERNYARLDWQVLDWNDSAIAFYKKYGAEISSEWLNGRFDRKALKKAAENG